MVVGVDDVSAVVGLTAFCLTICQGCFKGFVILSHARHCDRRVTNLALRLELEQLKLFLWADRAGLLAEIPQLRVSRHFRHFVPEILKQLKELLCDAQVMRSKYGITIQETSDILTDIDSDELTLSMLDIHQLPVVQKLNDNTVQMIRASPNPWRRVKWVASDEQHFRRLLDDISALTSQLQSLLARDDDEEIGRQVDTVLRSAIIGSSNPRVLSMLSKASQEHCLGALAAPAQLKKKSILSGLFGRRRQIDNSSHTSSKPELSMEEATSHQTTRPSSRDTLVTKQEPRKLSNALLDLPDLHYCSRQLAYYNDQPALIEWRDSNTNDWKKLESRIGRFSTLLSDMSEHNSFHSLPCLGFVKHPRTGQYGYVFDVSVMGVTASGVSQRQSSIPKRRPLLPTFRNLRDLLNIPSLQPSLNLRVSYAIVALETILQLHTAGWLHKEIRSDNVVFVGSGIAQADYGLLRSSTFIAGYVYAREDECSEFSESLKLDPEADLYRHPSTAMGVCRQPYRMSFDIFSIACVLLEIGLWKPLSQILVGFAQSAVAPIESQMMELSLKGHHFSVSPSTPPTTPDPRLDHNLEVSRSSTNFSRSRRELLAQFTSRNSNPGNVVELLEARTGETYMNIVKDCFNIDSEGYKTAMNGRPSRANEVTENKEVLDFEKRALEKLRALAEAL